MFVVVSQRPDFSRRCETLLSRLGKVRTAGSVADVSLIPDRNAVSLIVVDSRAAEAVTPPLIRDWLSQCGGARMLLADTSLAPLDELAALAAGAVACCDAGLQPDDFKRVIDVVLHGGVWVSKAAIPLLMTKLQTFSATQAPAPSGDGLDGLTERQREVAKMIGRGASNKQIARALDISDRTVKAHLTTIFEKLGISDRLQLALHVNRTEMRL